MQSANCILRIALVSALLLPAVNISFPHMHAAPVVTALKRVLQAQGIWGTTHDWACREALKEPPLLLTKPSYPSTGGGSYHSEIRDCTHSLLPELGIEPHV